MNPHVTVSRYFEPVPELAVEARYTFDWDSKEQFSKVTLSMRRHKENRHNSQFDKIENIDLSKVPDDVIQEAREKLRDCGEALVENAAKTETDQ